MLGLILGPPESWRGRAHRVDGAFQFFAHTAKLLQLLGFAYFCMVPATTRIALPGVQDFETVIVGQTSIADNIGRVAVIAGWVELCILQKLGLFHRRTAFRATGQGNARPATTFRIASRMPGKGMDNGGGKERPNEKI